MSTETNTVDHREPFALGRLLVRSVILGAFVPVTQGEFWDVKIVQVVSALVVCLVLYGLEKAVLYQFLKRVSIRPIHLAAYRGALLYALLMLGTSGDWAQALGAGIGGALAALLLFKLEEGIVKLVSKRTTTNPPHEAPSDK